MKVNWVCQRAANALTAGNLPTSIFSLTPSIMAFFYCERSSRKVIGELLPVKNNENKKSEFELPGMLSSNSRHWFTTSFLQPLPGFAMPQVSPKRSANGQFFIGAQMAQVCSRQIIPGISFITAHVAYASTNKTRILWIKTELLFFLPGADAPHVYMRAWMQCCFHSLIISAQTFRRALTALVDSCAEITVVIAVVIDHFYM